MFVLQLVIILGLVVAAVVLLVLTLQRESTRDAKDRSLGVAQAFAQAPGVAQALRSPDPTAVLQARAEAAREGSGIDFVVVVDRDGIRRTHPNPELIGEDNDEDMSPLLAGRTIQSETTGSLGPQYRAFVPVRAADGAVVGAVSAGVTIENVDDRVAQEIPALLGAAAGAMALTVGGAALLSRRLLRQTHGLGPTEITRMYEHHDAVLHSVREGVVIVDGARRLLLANDEAHRLLDIPPDAQGRRTDELGLTAPVAELLASGRAATDEVIFAGGRLLAVNQRPLDRYKGPRGSVVTLRDSTELRVLAGRAEAATERLKVLYDASVRIGTSLDVTRTAEELAEVAVPQYADFVSVDLAEPVLHGDEPVGAEKELRRTAVRGIREDPPFYPLGSLIEFVRATPQAVGLNRGRAVLETDLADASGLWAQDAERVRQIVDYGVHSLITAPLYARGVVLGVANFWRSQRSEPFEDDDLALAEELVARAAVCIDNARRYTREHTTAVALQRSLLPRRLPEQNAVDIAYRYLPARQGMGGDWFDVIPLPGARVALVVGDVVGQGLSAAAAMGRLRTAVRTFSSLDLMPDELLARLDELAVGEETREADDAIVGATCLYAVYDPVARRCALARAGHPPPALTLPDGTVRYLEPPAGPPLGVGGMPFEATETEVPEGSRLVLYTDGLLEHRDRDIDVCLDTLAGTLRDADGTLEDTCGAVLDALLPEPQRDDIALLVARTHVLRADRMARWDVPRDPAAVGRVRNAVADQLTAWELDELGFVTELVLSELITNAIRYASGSIGVRLLHDRKLICEVSDGSSTSPRLRYAATTDEGGRGLFLVAQLADRWGTRYTAEGKVIWAEQTLPSRTA
ncbi:SpoIIE family protein phosphatase [Streptomyces ferrugineus]|uniref:SpoIIE family protein phosphatase n=2 Tax=Streptomyces ferrugineus TaxID=1413221 RepID=A0A7M2T0B7_9ACTN|nr:SpoIIE family protein phosphatase [Streptomyces ferrugineus]QOV41263.1 SpoIIE family protein phosphatase [Streptomyces ferrugineus]